MAFRERIEAVLKAKDAGRFKAAMNVSSKAVEHFEKSEQRAEAQSLLLDQVLEALEHQTDETTAAIALLSHEVNALGHDMLQTAGNATVMNAAMKKSGSNAVFLGKSWAFWKDRLSLTRSEVYTTALTIGTYLSPALIALGSSFAYAAIGGGAVAASGMATFVVGLLGIVSVAKPVFSGLQKITQAQYQLNIAIDQYGAASIQASRANAHLFAVIKNNGGPAVASLLVNIQDLRDEWAKLTKSGRSDFVDIMRQFVAGGQQMAPVAASATNQAVGGLRSGVLSVMGDLTGGEARSTLKAIGDIFSKSIGPGIRGTVNLLVIFGRVIKGSAPWVIKLSLSYERFTKSLRQRATQKSVNMFLGEAVGHFKAWWGLAKELGRTVSLLMEGSRRQGRDLVVQLTLIVEKFNDWLQKMEDTGAVDRFFKQYIQSLKDVVWALQNPIEALDRFMPEIVAAINTYLPVLMDAVANTLAHAGPHAAEIFLQAFVDAGAWAKFLTVTYFLRKFGFFSALGKKVAAIFVAPFISAFVASFSGAMFVESAAGGRIAAAMTSAGTSAGTLFGRAFLAGVVLIIPIITYKIEQAIINSIGPLKRFYESLPDNETLGEFFKNLDPRKFFNRFRHRASGGMIFPGQTSWVGERGPEPISVTSQGAMVTPNNRVQAMARPVIDVPDIANALRLVSNVSIQIDRREIARAVADQRSYDSARRGRDS